MKDKIILITQITLGILMIAFFVFTGLNGFIWRDASRTDSIILILAPPILVAMLTSFGLTMWKKRRVNKGLEQWPAKGEINGTLETLLRVIRIIAVLGGLTLWVWGMVVWNRELFRDAGIALGASGALGMPSARSKQARREQDEKADAENAEE
ncbi:MAG: hypothetical protein FWC72_03925 [Oscillospiraceae bacterium]|nr:hypothetical protein [Oscillospiraceae bacterium]